MVHTLVASYSVHLCERKACMENRFSGFFGVLNTAVTFKSWRIGFAMCVCTVDMACVKSAPPMWSGGPRNRCSPQFRAVCCLCICTATYAREIPSIPSEQVFARITHHGNA
jgi:hypothetical protein